MKPPFEIFVNGRFLTQRISGVQVFARELCHELLKEFPIKIIIPAKAILSDNEFSDHVIRTGILTGHAWEQLSLPAYIKKKKNTILLNFCNTAPLTLKNQLVTIHDLAFIKNPDWFNYFFSKAYQFLIPRIIKKSRFVITVSHTVRKEIIDTFKIPENKIEVIGNKVGSKLLNSTSVFNDHKLSKNNFFLMVGSMDPRKNFIMVEQLFAESFPDIKLVLVGGSYRSFKTENKHIQKSDNIIHLGFIGNGKLKWLYENAIGLINPSFYEGFGIPNIEAMALECPVICSDIVVFKEICEDAAIYFNPINKQILQNIIFEIRSGKLQIEAFTFRGKSIFTKFQSQNRAAILLNFLSQ